MAETVAVGGELIDGDILMGKGDLGAEQNDQPAQLQPYQKERQRREAAIDGAVTGDADLEFDVGELRQLIDRPGQDPAAYCGFSCTLVLGMKAYMKLNKNQITVYGKSLMRKMIMPAA